MTRGGKTDATRPEGSAERREARAFGLSVGGVCALLAAWALWRNRMLAAAVLGLVATVLIGTGLTVPAVLRRPNAWWRKFSHALGWVNTRVILSVFYFVVLTPVGAVLRALGRDPLGRRQRRDPTGWVPYPVRQRDPRHYERMY